MKNMINASGVSLNNSNWDLEHSVYLMQPVYLHIQFGMDDFSKRSVQKTHQYANIQKSRSNFAHDQVCQYLAVKIHLYTFSEVTDEHQT